SHVRFTPNSDRESGLPQTVMSALPPKADTCSATRDVCFGPKADIASFDHFVGTGEQRLRNYQPDRLRGLEIDYQLELGRLLDWKIGSFRTTQNFVDVVRRVAKQLLVAWAVRHEALGLRNLPDGRNGRQPRRRSKRIDLIPIGIGQRIADHIERIRA